MNEFLTIFYSADETGGGAAADETTQETGGEAAQPFKVFQTEEEYNKEVKSAESRGKFSILQKLGVKSIDEAKTNLDKSATLETELNETKSKYEKLETELLLTKEGVKEEYAEEALILARAKVNEETDLKAALSSVLEKFPKMRSATNPKLKIGGDTGAEDDEDTINNYFKNNPKYAHIKL